LGPAKTARLGLWDDKLDIRYSFIFKPLNAGYQRGLCTAVL